MTVSARDLIDATAARPVRPVIITSLAAAGTMSGLPALAADALRRETVRAADADLRRALAASVGPAALLRALTPSPTDPFRPTRHGAT